MMRNLVVAVACFFGSFSLFAAEPHGIEIPTDSEEYQAIIAAIDTTVNLQDNNASSQDQWEKAINAIINFLRKNPDIGFRDLELHFREKRIPAYIIAAKKPSAPRSQLNAASTFVIGLPTKLVYIDPSRTETPEYAFFLTISKEIQYVVKTLSDNGYKDGSSYLQNLANLEKTGIRIPAVDKETSKQLLSAAKNGQKMVFLGE